MPSLTINDLDETDVLIAEERAREAARNGILPFTVYTKPDYRINWHHRLIASKLDQFSKGEIKRLIIAAPPQAGGKSELVSRRLPPFILGKHPGKRVLAASYSAELIQGMSRRCLSIMRQDEYRELFPSVRVGGGLKEAVEEWDTSTGGGYKCSGAEGGITGQVSDYAILDDLIKGRAEANSATVRKRIWSWLEDEVLSRLGAHGSCLLMATRWHEEDPTGMILAMMENDPLAEKWETLIIPARLDREEDRVPGDPRQIGESMWPWYYAGKVDGLSKQEMHARAKVFLERWERRNPLGFASLAQQNPTPLKGDMFERDWFRYIDAKDLPKGMRTLRYWDRAATIPSPTNPNPDWTAGALCGEYDGNLYIIDMEHFQDDTAGNHKRTRTTAERDGYDVPVYLEQEPGSAGKDAIYIYVTKVLKGFSVFDDKPTGDKTVRASPVAALAKNGHVFLVRGAWNHAFVAEAVTFPNGKKDQIDAVSGAYKYLFQHVESEDESLDY